MAQVVAPAALHSRVCSHDSSCWESWFYRRVFEPVPAGSVGKEKAGGDGVCLLTWYRSTGVVTSYSDCDNSDSNPTIKIES